MSPEPNPLDADHDQHAAQGIYVGCGACIHAAVTAAAETATRSALAPFADTLANLIFTKHLLRTALLYGTLPSALRDQITAALDEMDNATTLPEVTR